MDGSLANFDFSGIWRKKCSGEWDWQNLFPNKMKAVKIHIITLLSLVILFPSGMSLAHIFVHHHEPSCSDHGQGHYHTQKYDCHFSLFFRTLSFSNKLESYDLQVFTIHTEYFHHLYESVPQKISLTSSLRGPPSFS